MGLGSRGTASGGRTRLSLDEPALRPEQLSQASQLNLLSGLGLMANEGISEGLLTSFLTNQKNFYLQQFKQLASNEQGTLKQRFEEHMDTYGELDKNGQLDPRVVEVTQQVFDINQNSSGDNEDVLTAGIVHTALKGVTGPSCVALGGYDYHDNTATTGDARDRRAGVVIGRSIELAHRMGQPLFFQVVTDGGCTARTGARNWVADSGDRSMTLIGYYNPMGATQIKTQLGHYTNGQIASVNTYVGRTTSNAANLAFLNYLATIDKVGEVGTILSNIQLPTNVIDSSIAMTHSN